MKYRIFMLIALIIAIALAALSFFPGLKDILQAMNETRGAWAFFLGAIALLCIACVTLFRKR